MTVYLARVAWYPHNPYERKLRWVVWDDSKPRNVMYGRGDTRYTILKQWEEITGSKIIKVIRIRGIMRESELAMQLSCPTREIKIPHGVTDPKQLEKEWLRNG